MITTFIILLITTLLFIIGKYRADFIAVGSLLALVLFDIITPAEALAGFSSSVVVMLAGLFIVGAGIFNTGLAEQIGNKLIVFGKNSEIKMLTIVMLTVAPLSAFMSNTGTVAVLLPVVASMALASNISPAKLLIPLAFASSLGGVLTLIGTPANLVASNTLTEYDFTPLHFFSLTPIGLVALITGILFMVTIGRKLLPQHEGGNMKGEIVDPYKLAGTYKIYPHLIIGKVADTSPLVGKTLAELQLAQKYGVTIVSIARKNGYKINPLKQSELVIPKARTEIQANDILLLFGKLTNKKDFLYKFHLMELPSDFQHEARKFLLSEQYGITEIILPPQSKLLEKTIRDVHFRKKYGCTVLSLFRNGEYIQVDAGKIRLKAGDALLIHGPWERMEALAKSTTDFIVVGRVTDVVATEVARGKAPLAALIMLFMLVFMTFNILEPVITVLVAAFFMIITGCVRSLEDGYRAIEWSTVILIGAMLPMATALEKTGGIEMISDVVIHTLGNLGPYILLIGFYVLTALLSQVISNSAIAVIFVPVAINLANEMAVSPLPFVIAVAVAASMAFMTPFSTPPNALVMNAGGYRFYDYVKIGTPLLIVVSIVVLIFIPIFYPF